MVQVVGRWEVDGEKGWSGRWPSCDKVKLEVGGSSDESSDNWDICFLIMLWNLLPWQG